MSDEITNETSPEETAAPLAESPAEPAAEETAAVELEEVAAPVEEAAAPEVSETRFDKLQKAEEILRASSPESSRESVENAFEKVVHINRCSKVVKGGRRFSFSALVVSGDRSGNVGFGFGKAQEVSECIKKSSEASKKQMMAVNITHNTIPHPVIGEHGGARVLLFPASPGTGLIAGAGVRAVVEAAGIKDVLAKSMGSNNPANVVKATLKALGELRSKEQIYSVRGKRLPDRKAL
jgi:small subunit ribosomal protein S5